MGYEFIFFMELRVMFCLFDSVFSLFNCIIDRNFIVVCIGRFFSMNGIILDKFDILLYILLFCIFMLIGCFVFDIRYF